MGPGAAARLSALQHAARPRARDQGDRLGRVQHGLQPLPRRRQRAIAATGRTLTGAGVKHTGTFTSSAARGRTLLLKVKGVRVAFLSYTEMTNGIPLPSRGR